MSGHVKTGLESRKKQMCNKKRKTIKLHITFMNIQLRAQTVS